MVGLDDAAGIQVAASVGDVDNDGFADLALATGGPQDIVYLFMGRNNVTSSNWTLADDFPRAVRISLINLCQSWQGCPGGGNAYAKSIVALRYDHKQPFCVLCVLTPKKNFRHSSWMFIAWQLCLGESFDYNSRSRWIRHVFSSI